MNPTFVTQSVCDFCVQCLQVLRMQWFCGETFVSLSSSSPSSSEIVDFLQQRVVPDLKKKLSKFSEEERQEELEQQEDTYLLSHIFNCEDDGNEFQEVDNSQRTAGQSGQRWI